MEIGHKSISVIIATYNGSKYIRQQLDSILDQTLKPDEIIICDDNSTDDTVSIIKPYLNNPVIKLLVNTTGLGVVANFKKAAQHANQGNWIVFCDQDDMWVPEKLERLKSEMLLIDDDHTPALVYSDLTVIDKQNNIIADSFWAKLNISPTKLNFGILLYGNVITGCTMIINYPMAQEFFLMDAKDALHDEWLALIAYSFGKVTAINEKLVLYRQHESNVTFSEEYEKNAAKASSSNALKRLFIKPGILSQRFDLVPQFLSKYRDRLIPTNIKTINHFLASKNRSTLYHKIKFRLLRLRA